MRNPKFLGVYSLKTSTRSGARPKFFIWELPDGSYAAQELDAAMTQRGSARGIPHDGLAKAFVFEPSILAAPVTTPDFRPMIKPVTAQAPAEDDASDATLSELERARRVKQLETAMRDGFERAMRALGRQRERKGALAALERIATTRDGIEPEHKFMFRDFGVALRKKKLLDLAITCARRVVELAPHDDHARFNLARALGLAGNYDEAEAQLAAARKLNPKEKIYNRLTEYLRQQRSQAGHADSD